MGSTFRLLVDEEVKTDLTYGEASTVIQIFAEQEIGIRVLEKLPTGEFLLEVTPGHAQGEVKTPYGETSFDSDDPPEVLTVNENFYIHYIELAGKTYQAVLSNLGIVEEVRGYKGLLDGTDCGRLMDTLSMPRDNEAAKEALQWVLPPLPEPSSQQGGSWQTTYPLKMLGDRIIFTPNSLIEDSTDEAFAWSFVTDMDGESRDDAAIGDTDPGASGYIWHSQTSELGSAGLRGHVKLSKRDGMLLEHDTRVNLKLAVVEPSLGIDMALDVVQERKIRRVEGAEPAEK